MSILDKLLNEQDIVFATEWWKVYRRTLSSYKEKEIRTLITSSDTERLPGLQASIRTLEWVEGMPDRILDSQKEK